MRRHDLIQGESDWHKLRIGKVTASELHNLVDTNFDLRTGQTPRTYLCTKLAELWRNAPLPGFNVFDVEQGEILQNEALPWYALNYEVKVGYIGFIETDDGLFGCSPDGLIGDDSGIEVKCPAAQTHVKYLLDGKVPNEYLAQVHGAMFATGFPKWTFMSYRRGFPALVIEVERDEAICEKIDAAVKWFHTELAKGKERIAHYE